MLYNRRDYSNGSDVLAAYDLGWGKDFISELTDSVGDSDGGPIRYSLLCHRSCGHLIPALGGCNAPWNRAGMNILAPGLPSGAS